MQSYYFEEKNNWIILWKGIGIISFIIPIVVLILILNWVLEITPFQQLQGQSILLPVVASPVGIIFAAISLMKTNYSYAKLGLIFNSTLLIIPFFTKFIGSFIFDL